MASFEPEGAIGAVKNCYCAHEVLQALNEPADGDQRVDKVYSRNTSPQTFKLDFEGMTELYTL